MSETVDIGQIVKGPKELHLEQLGQPLVLLDAHMDIVTVDVEGIHRLVRENDDLRQQLTAAEARERELRERIDLLDTALRREQQKRVESEAEAWQLRAILEVYDANAPVLIATQSRHAALDAALAAAEVRERNKLLNELRPQFEPEWNSGDKVPEGDGQGSDWCGMCNMLRVDGHTDDCIWRLLNNTPDPYVSGKNGQLLPV